MDDARQQLLRVYAAVLKAVDGAAAAHNRLVHAQVGQAVHLVAIGKAAVAMAHGACDALGDRLAAALVITKHGYGDPDWRDPRVTLLEAGHPLPDADSLTAGDRLLQFIQQAPADAPFVFLISGGASALVEVLPEGVGLEQLRAANEWLLGCGWDIARINRIRRALSCIKGGRLARHLGERPVLNLLLSDVPGDDPAVIGSGLLVPDPLLSSPLPDGVPAWLRSLAARTPAPPAAVAAVTTEMLLSNRDARVAALAAAIANGWQVHAVPGLVTGDALERGRELAASLLAGPHGLYILGGETTVRLPAVPGRGGRCQALALAAAQLLSGHEECYLLAAGTDGSDGPTEDGGALVDGGTIARGALGGLDADECLARADAGSFLEASGDLIQTGPTGSNVMDVILALKMA